MSYSATAADDFDRPRITLAVQWLIAINVAVFFFQETIGGAANTQAALGFQAQDVPLFAWKALTYMFVHGGLWHILGNMYMLWLFGTRVEHRWSAAAFTRYYILCGLGAAFLEVLLRGNGLLVGASGAVYGVMLAYAVNWPNEELLLFGIVPLKVKWLVFGYVLYDLVLGLGQLSGASGDNVAHMAHLGGLATGWLLLRVPSARRPERVRHRVSAVPDVPVDAAPRPVPRTLPRPQREPEIDDVVAKSKAAVARRPVTPPPPPAPRPPQPAKPARSEDLDVLLDKISEQGIESLTQDERQLLEAASRRLRETT